MNTLRHALISLLFIGSLATGCEKSTDLGRLQEEALNTVKLYQPRVDELARRSDQLLQRGRSIQQTTLPGIADAGRALGEARAELDRLKGDLQAAPTQVAAAVKAANTEELDKVIDETREKLDKGLTSANGNLDAVESWLAAADQRASAQPAPAPPPPAPADTTPPADPAATPAPK